MENSLLFVKKKGALYEVSEYAHGVSANHPTHHVYIYKTRRGLKIPLNTHTEGVYESKRDPRPRYAPMRYIGTCVLTLLPLVFIVRRFALQNQWADVWEFTGVYLILWGGLLGVFWLLSLAATEVLVLSDDRLIFTKAYGGIPYRQRPYFTEYIQHPRAGRMPGMIEFTYGDRDVGRQTNLADGERAIFLRLLAMLLSCPYHAVETVVFGGEFVVKDSVSTVMQNPEAAAFTLPLFRLKHVLVYPESTSFLHLERFLTYVVNALGQQELKHAVAVHLYGNPEQLPSHLRNALTQFFHGVYLHDKDEIFPEIQDMIQHQGDLIDHNEDRNAR
jgi:hypothetical protein